MNCKMCGKEFEKVSYLGKYENVCSTKCFNDSFWEERVQLKKENRLIIIKGEAYVDAGKTTDLYCGFNGFGGREFKIKMNTGEIIETNNLWHNGTVPENYAKQLEDNAIFL